MTLEVAHSERIRRVPSLAVLAASVVVSILIGGAAIRNGMTAWSLRNDDPQAALWWSPKASAALTAAAAEHLKAGRDINALQAAREALLRSPYDVTALWVIGMVEGRRDLSRQRIIMQHASLLSNRHSALGSWLLTDALAAGDFKTVAFQADMLLRRRVAVDDSLFRVLYGVIQTPSGRAALVERLELRPPWREPFLGGAGLAADPTDVAELLVALRSAGASPTDDETQQLFKRLVVERRYNEVRLARSRIFGAPADKDELVYDPDLNGLPGPSPLNWELLSTSGGRYDWKIAASDTGRIRLQSAPSTSGVLLRQLIFLRPGQYSVSVTAQYADREAAAAFSLEVQCDSRILIARRSLQASSDAPETTVQNFSVPLDDCAAQWLQIHAISNSFTNTEIDLDRIDVHPAPSFRTRFDG